MEKILENLSNFMKKQDIGTKVKKYCIYINTILAKNLSYSPFYGVFNEKQ